MRVLASFSGVFLLQEIQVFSQHCLWGSEKVKLRLRCHVLYSSSAIRQKGKPQNGCYKKIRHVKFFESRRFTPDTHTHLCVWGGRKCLVFGKLRLLFFLLKPVLRFALLPYYRRVHATNLLSKPTFSQTLDSDFDECNYNLHKTTLVSSFCQYWEGNVTIHLLRGGQWNRTQEDTNQSSSNLFPLRINNYQYWYLYSCSSYWLQTYFSTSIDYVHLILLLFLKTSVTSQLIKCFCFWFWALNYLHKANQLTGFYFMATLAFNELS